MTSTEQRAATAGAGDWPRARGRRPLAALSGLLAATVALGVAELVCVAVGPQASPVAAIGSAAIDRVPASLKQFAVDQFGTNDKLVLLGGIIVVLAGFAALLGLLALRRRWVSAAGIAVLGLVGAVAAGTRPTASPLSALPSLLGAVAGVLALLAMLARLGQRQAAHPSVPGSDEPPPGTEHHPTDDHARGAAARLPGTDAGRTGLDRRGFLIAGGATAAAAAVTGGIGAALLARTYDAGASRVRVQIPAPASRAAAAPPAVDLKTPGLSPFFTDNADFYRVDTALVVPQLSAADWTLRIHGMVDRERTLSYADLLGRDLIERDITLMCVSNEVGGPYIGNARWMGVPLKPLLTEIGVVSGADQIVTRSVDGWTAGTPVDAVLDGRDAMLAVAMNGQPLPLAHGFPVRLLVPGLYGYVSATKWIVDMKLTTFDSVATYWRRRGWSAKAPIKTQSRIDTPKPFTTVPAGHVPVAGVAWAQHTGVAKVEVSVDGGPWQPTRLAAEDTTDTWRQWVYDWHAVGGNHTIRVRATDKAGYTQTGHRVPPIPDGATGWASTAVTVQ